jgi:hypothetical protein
VGKATSLRTRFTHDAICYRLLARLLARLFARLLAVRPVAYCATTKPHAGVYTQRPAVEKSLDVILGLSDLDDPGTGDLFRVGMIEVDANTGQVGNGLRAADTEFPFS